MSQIQCVVVTPEKTELDVRANSVTIPLFDGEMGILKGHSPFVGRLGYGVLRIATGSDNTNFFIEGGFVQVDKDVVSILTDRLTDVKSITAAEAEAALDKAIGMPSGTPELTAARQKACDRARAMKQAAK